MFSIYKFLAGAIATTQLLSVAPLNQESSHFRKRDYISQSINKDYRFRHYNYNTSRRGILDLMRERDILVNRLENYLLDTDTKNTNFDNFLENTNRLSEKMKRVSPLISEELSRRNIIPKTRYTISGYNKGIQDFNEDTKSDVLRPKVKNSKIDKDNIIIDNYAPVEKPGGTGFIHQSLLEDTNIRNYILVKPHVIYGWQQDHEIVDTDEKTFIKKPEIYRHNVSSLTEVEDTNQNRKLSFSQAEIEDTEKSIKELSKEKKQDVKEEIYSSLDASDRDNISENVQAESSSNISKELLEYFKNLEENKEITDVVIKLNSLKHDIKKLQDRPHLNGNVGTAKKTLDRVINQQLGHLNDLVKAIDVEAIREWNKLTSYISLSKATEIQLQELRDKLESLKARINKVSLEKADGYFAKIKEIIKKYDSLPVYSVNSPDTYALPGVVSMDEVISKLYDLTSKERKTTIIFSVDGPFAGDNAAFSANAQVMFDQLTNFVKESGEISRINYNAGGQIDYRNRKTTYNFTVKLEYWLGPEHREAIKNYHSFIKDWVYENIKSKGITDAAMISKLIKSYLATEYNYAFKELETNSPTKSGVTVHHPVAFLTDGVGVCQAYAIMFRDMAKEAGVEAHYVTGGSRDPRTGVRHGSHAWNVVKIEGEYYNVDATWDDTNKNDPKESWEHFLEGQSFLLDHVEDFPGKYNIAMHDYDVSNIGVKRLADIRREREEARRRYQLEYLSRTNWTTS